MNIHVIDFAWNGTQTLFVDVHITIEDTTVKGMVRIVDGLIYGDLVHLNRSELSEREILILKEFLQKKITLGHFEA